MWKLNLPNSILNFTKATDYTKISTIRPIVRNMKFVHKLKFHDKIQSLPKKKKTKNPPDMKFLRKPNLTIKFIS